MRTMTALMAGLALAIAVSGCSRPAGAAAAADAMGATNLNSIQFSGSGFVSGDIRGISGFQRVSRLEGGDDRLEARAGSTADITGDAIQLNIVYREPWTCADS